MTPQETVDMLLENRISEISDPVAPNAIPLASGLTTTADTVNDTSIRQAVDLRLPEIINAMQTAANAGKYSITRFYDAKVLHSDFPAAVVQRVVTKLNAAGYRATYSFEDDRCEINVCWDKKGNF